MAEEIKKPLKKLADYKTLGEGAKEDKKPHAEVDAKATEKKEETKQKVEEKPKIVTKSEVSKDKVVEDKPKSVGAAKQTIPKPKSPAKETKILEREYIVPLRKGAQKVPRYKRAKKAIKVLKQFLAKHMKVENRDISKVKIDRYLNQEIWFRGIKKPPAKIKVKAVKTSEGIVHVELAEIPDKVKFDILKEQKSKLKQAKIKPSISKEDTSKKPAGVLDKPTEESARADAGAKKETEEAEKSSVEAGLEIQKQQAKQTKHTTQAKQINPKRQLRKALKK